VRPRRLYGRSEELEQLKAIAAPIQAVAQLLAEEREHGEMRRAGDAHVIGAVLCALGLTFLAVILYDDGRVLRDLITSVTQNGTAASIYLAIGSGVALIGYQAYRLEYLHPVVPIAICWLVTALLIWATSFDSPTLGSPLKVGHVDFMPWLLGALTIPLIGAWFYLEARKVAPWKLAFGLVTTLVGVAAYGALVYTNYSPNALSYTFQGALGVLVVAGLFSVALPAFFRGKRRAQPTGDSVAK
jgi:hypothetical protein